jgi:hypothetical protein
VSAERCAPCSHLENGEARSNEDQEPSKKSQYVSDSHLRVYVPKVRRSHTNLRTIVTRLKLADPAQHQSESRDSRSPVTRAVTPITHKQAGAAVRPRYDIFRGTWTAFTRAPARASLRPSFCSRERHRYRLVISCPIAKTALKCATAKANPG